MQLRPSVRGYVHVHGLKKVRVKTLNAEPLQSVRWSSMVLEHWELLTRMKREQARGIERREMHTVRQQENKRVSLLLGSKKDGHIEYCASRCDGDATPRNS